MNQNDVTTPFVIIASSKYDLRKNEGCAKYL